MKRDLLKCFEMDREIFGEDAPMATYASSVDRCLIVIAAGLRPMSEEQRAAAINLLGTVEPDALENDMYLAMDVYDKIHEADYKKIRSAQ